MASYFYPRSPYGERPTHTSWELQDRYFYPRSPYGERRWVVFPQYILCSISIHALLTESDRLQAVQEVLLSISIHALLTESDQRSNQTTACGTISIHALLTESDPLNPLHYLIFTISIHALLTESDRSVHRTIDTASKFLSTLSLRRATFRLFLICRHLFNFYPRSPYGERPGKISSVLPGLAFLSTLSLRRATRADGLPHAPPHISIHALLTESDGCEQYCIRAREISIHALLTESDNLSPSTHQKNPSFLSTLSLRRATAETAKISTGDTIFLSTLSLRRATFNSRFFFHLFFHFYPRSPYGERHIICQRISVRVDISIHALLTESDRCKFNWHNGKIISIHALLTESDCLPGFWRITPEISIHALLTESDDTPSISIPKPGNFYPRSPYGERPDTNRPCKPCKTISIHALLTESDPEGPAKLPKLIGFLSTLSLRRATSKPKDLKSRRMVFLSTLSLRRATCSPGFGFC